MRGQMGELSQLQLRGRNSCSRGRDSSGDKRDFCHLWQSLDGMVRAVRARGSPASGGGGVAIPRLVAKCPQALGPIVIGAERSGMAWAEHAF